MSAADREKTLNTVNAVIAAAQESVRDQLPDNWSRIVSERAQKFASAAKASRLNVFLFHQSVSGQAQVVNTIDIKGLDHGKFDYDLLIRRNIAIALWSNPGARIILVTDDAFIPQGIDDERVSIVRLSLVDGEPMFERVVAMLAYAESAAFTAPTIFLDSDAFLIRHCAGLFANEFDVAVTYRDISGQMPINEGVILVNDCDQESVRRFFRCYLATYLTLEQHPLVVETYGNVRRWRGGQLSINAVSGGRQRYAASIVAANFNARIAYLPCSRFNYSPDQEGEINPTMLARALVLHLKGNRKPWLDRMVAALGSFGFFEY